MTTTAQLLADLNGRGVRLSIEGHGLRIEGPAGKLTPELDSVIRARKADLVAVLADRASTPMPTEREARAIALRRIGRRSGFDADALFERIDAMFGYRLLGPFDLTAEESQRLADVLSSVSGTRPAIEDAAPPVTPISTCEPRSIARKRSLGWPDSRFSTHCLHVLGAPGIRTAADDLAVLAAMPKAPRSVTSEAGGLEIPRIEQ